MLTTLLVLASAAFAAALVWLWARSRSAVLAATLAEHDDQLAKALVELTALRAKREELNIQVARLDNALKVSQGSGYRWARP